MSWIQEDSEQMQTNPRFLKDTWKHPTDATPYLPLLYRNGFFASLDKIESLQLMTYIPVPGHKQTAVEAYVQISDVTASFAKTGQEKHFWQKSWNSQNDKRFAPNDFYQVPQCPPKPCVRIGDVTA